MVWHARLEDIYLGQSAAPTGWAQLPATQTISLTRPAAPGVPFPTFQVRPRFSLAWLSLANYLSSDVDAQSASGALPINGWWDLDRPDRASIPRWAAHYRPLFQEAGHNNFDNWWLQPGLALKVRGDQSVESLLTQGPFDYGPNSQLPVVAAAIGLGATLAQSALGALSNSFQYRPTGVANFFERMAARTGREGMIFIKVWAGDTAFCVRRDVHLPVDWLRWRIGGVPEAHTWPELQAGSIQNAAGLFDLIEGIADIAGLIAHEVGHGVYWDDFGLSSGIENQWEGPDFRNYFASGGSPLEPRLPTAPFGSASASRHWTLEWIRSVVQGYCLAEAFRDPTPGAQAYIGLNATRTGLDAMAARYLDQTHRAACVECCQRFFGAGTDLLSGVDPTLISGLGPSWVNRLGGGGTVGRYIPWGSGACAAPTPPCAGPVPGLGPVDCGD